MNLDLTKALAVVGQLPQTQADISKIAQTAQNVQTPEFQAQLQQAETYALGYAGISLALQAVLTMTAVMTLLLLMRREDRESKAKKA